MLVYDILCLLNSKKIDHAYKRKLEIDEPAEEINCPSWKRLQRKGQARKEQKDPSATRLQ